MRRVSAPLLAVDGPSLLYRAFYALPDSIKDGKGQPVNALLGTTNLILQEVERHEPRAVVLCFGAEAAEYRVELHDGYHADRPEVPDDLQPQFDAVPEFFGAFGWLVSSHPKLEADDLLGSYADLETEAGGKALLLTGDRDMFQCASGSVTVLYLTTGVRGATEVGPEEVRERYGIPPELVPDFIALRGDPSDGIPGAKGVGPEDGRGIAARARLAGGRAGARGPRDEAGAPHQPARRRRCTRPTTRTWRHCATPASSARATGRPIGRGPPRRPRNAG